MPTPTVLRQGLELFRSMWPHRFPDQDSYDRLLTAYAIGCEELTDDEWLAACRAGLKASDHLPTPAELNRWVRPDRDPNRDPTLDYRPVNTITPVLYDGSMTALPPASAETRAQASAEHQAEWERNKAKLRAMWDRMREDEKAKPAPGPGFAVLRRGARRRTRTADYAERGLADMHLQNISADLAEHRQRAAEEGNAAWEQTLRRRGIRRIGGKA